MLAWTLVVLAHPGPISPPNNETQTFQLSLSYLLPNDWVKLTWTQAQQRARHVT